MEKTRINGKRNFKLIQIIFLGIVLGICTIIFLAFQIIPSTYSRESYRNQLLRNDPETIFILPVTPFSIVKYAIKSALTKNNDSLCDKFQRPYSVNLPEEDIESQREMCRDDVKNLLILIKTRESGNNTECLKLFHDRPNYKNFCHDATIKTNWKKALKEYLGGTDNHMINMCGSQAEEYQKWCDMDVQNVDDLVKYANTLEAIKSNPEMQRIFN